MTELLAVIIISGLAGFLLSWWVVYDATRYLDGKNKPKRKGWTKSGAKWVE